MQSDQGQQDLEEKVERLTRELENRASSRGPPPTCSRSSAARRSICEPCSIRWSSHRNAAVQCGSQQGITDGKEIGLYHNIASCGYTPDQIEWLKRNPYKACTRSSVVGRVVLGREIGHVADTLVDGGIRGIR